MYLPREDVRVLLSSTPSLDMIKNLPREDVRVLLEMI